MVPLVSLLLLERVVQAVYALVCLEHVPPGESRVHLVDMCQVKCYLAVYRVAWLRYQEQSYDVREHCWLDVVLVK